MHEVSRAPHAPVWKLAIAGSTDSHHMLPRASGVSMPPPSSATAAAGQGAGSRGQRGGEGKQGGTRRGEESRGGGGGCAPSLVRRWLTRCSRKMAASAPAWATRTGHHTCCSRLQQRRKTARASGFAGAAGAAAASAAAAAGSAAAAVSELDERARQHRAALAEAACCRLLPPGCSAGAQLGLWLRRLAAGPAEAEAAAATSAAHGLLGTTGDRS